MELSFAALAGNLLAPTILFFVLGLIAAFAKSDLSIPEGAAKVMSIYLLLAIGFKGGAAVGESGIDSTLLASLGAGIVLSFILPFIAYALIRAMTRLRHPECIGCRRALWIDFNRDFRHGGQPD